MGLEAMKIEQRQFILDTLTKIDTAFSKEEVLEHYLVYARGLGFESYLISQIVNPLRPYAKDAMLHTNWPTELIERRFENQEIVHDPIVQFALKCKFAFSWDQAYQHASRFGRGMMNETREHGLMNGYSFPMRRPGAPFGGVSIGGNEGDLSPTQLRNLELVSMHTYSRLEALHPPMPYEQIGTLSPQETEVLYFAAVGKTAWETSKILGVSEAAIKDALKRVRTKLGAMNTLHACTTAISQDLIFP